MITLSLARTSRPPPLLCRQTQWSRLIDLQNLGAAVPPAEERDHLLASLDDPDVLVRGAAAAAARAQAAHPPLRAALLTALAEGPAAVQLGAIEALHTQAAHPLVWRALLRLLTDPGTATEVRAAAGAALGPQAANPNVLGELRALLATPDAGVFAAVVLVLTEQEADPTVRDALLPRLGAANPAIRLIALRALRCWIADPSVQAALRPLEADPDLGVRQTASAWLQAQRIATAG